MPDHERLSKRIDALKYRAASGERVYRSELNDLAASASDLEKRADRADRATALEVIEPPIYGPGSGHSWFADMMRVSRRYGEGDGGPQAAARRMHNHQAWQHHENERRLAALTLQAEHAAERELSQSVAEARLLERWLDAGGQLFERQHQLRDLERRAESGDSGFGASFIPPGWLIDQWIHAPRAGQPFAALWRSLPLPPHASSVNLPRFAPGARTGFQVDNATPVGGVDPGDGFASSQVRTLAAHVDVGMQWLDQCPVPPDETIGADMAEDFASNLDGTLLLGGGPSAGQLAGVIPGGVFSASSMVWLSDTNNTAAQSWANGAGATAGIAGSLHQMTAQLYSKITRYRAREPTAWVVPASVWAIIAGSGTDAQDRPLVPPGMHAASTVKMLHGLPLVVDENLPETFGGTTAPYMSNISAGRLSPTDGSGTWAPILLGRWSDCLYFQSEPIIRIMDEAITGTLQVRFESRCYVASHPGRVIWSGTSQTFSGTSQAGGLSNGAPVAYGALTNFVSNSILQPGSAGY